VCIAYAQAVKFKLQTGTVYSGTLVSSNENFFYISVNGSFIKILKSMVSEIDDKPYIQQQNPLNNAPQQSQPAISSPSITTKSQKADTLSKNTTNDVIVHLKNGNSFTGVLVSENERIIVLNINGSSVNIFKAIISEIDDPSKKNGTSPNITKVSPPPTVADTSRNTPSVSQVQKKSQLPDTNKNDIPTNLENARSVSSIKDTVQVQHNLPVATKAKANDTVSAVTKPVSNDTIVNKHTEIKNTQTYKQTSGKTVKPSKLPDSLNVVVKDTSLKTLSDKNSKAVDSTANADVKPQTTQKSQPELKKDMPQTSDTLQKINSGFSKAADTTKVLDPAQKDNTQLSAGSVHVQKKDSIPPIKKDATIAVPEKKIVKRADGKIEIILKNGAIFVGKIISEDDRIVRFESDGVVINIIKQLISSIDGVSFNNNGTSIKKDSLFSKREDLNYKSTSTNEITDTLPDLQRVFPRTEVPQGIKTSQLIDSLHSVSWEQRSKTTRIIAAQGLWGTEAMPELRKLLGDTLMGSSYEPVWIDSSNVSQLLSPGDEAARALSRMGDAGFNALRTLLRDTSTLVRRRAAFGLGELSTDPAWAALSEMLKDPDRGVRAVAVTGLRSTKFSDLIISMLKDEDAEVRADAAFMLGRMREHKAIRNLKTLLYDKRSFVRAQAADALCSIGGSEASQQLISASQDANLNVRENAAIALGEMGDSISVQPLLSLLRDKMPSVRIAAIIALSKIKDPQAIPSLYSMLKDEDPQVREQTEIALKKHTDIPTLIESLDNKKLIVRKNVLYMLWLMTGQDIDMNKELWQEWYSKSQVPLKLPLKK
jgi:HEAT repeat protein/small nuclear ribonucleoprotein (snRNP)-like protein